MKSLAVIALSFSLLAALTLCCPSRSQPAPPEDTPEPEPSPTETSVMEKATPTPPVATPPPPPPETPEAPPPPVASPTPPPPAASLRRGDLLGDMILVPAGEFIMGSSLEQIDYAFQLCEETYGNCQRSWFFNEFPQHTVYLDAFYIGRYEVTNAQYERFVEATGYEAPLIDWPDGSIPGGLENHPVVDVSWYDALAYCHWLSEETGQTVRLPTEAEWEKAARGTDGRVYPLGR